MGFSVDSASVDFSVGSASVGFSDGSAYQGLRVILPLEAYWHDDR